MSGYKTILLVFFCLLLSVGNSSGSDSPTIIPKQTWAKRAKAYNYDEDYKTMEKKPPKFDPLKREKVSAPMFPMKGVGYFFLVLVGIALVAVIIVLLIGLIKQPRNQTLPATKPRELSYENIEDADLERDLKDTLIDSNYKDAIRIRYLMVLQLLNKHRMIIWRKEKTNGHYIREMFGKAEYEIFRSLTIQFDRVWYGEIVITEKEYAGMIPVFDQIQQQISIRG